MREFCNFVAAFTALLVSIFALLPPANAQGSSPDSSLYYVANTTPPDAFLSLRTHPSASQGLRIMTMPNGTPLQVLERRPDGWWRVKVASSGQEGWALSRSTNRIWIECCITASVPAAAPEPAAKLVGFRTPSGNVHCAVDFTVEDQGPGIPVLRCDIRQISNRPPPRPRDCDLEWGQAFELRPDAAPATRLCYGDTVANEALPVLPYGRTWASHGYTCKSEQNGVTCVNAKGKGFELSRGLQRVF